MDGKPNGNGFGYKDLALGGKTYRLFSQEMSLWSPSGRTFGVFLLPAEPGTDPLVTKLQSSLETDQDMWEWAETMARLHAEQFGDPPAS